MMHSKQTGRCVTQAIMPRWQNQCRLLWGGLVLALLMSTATVQASHVRSDRAPQGLKDMWALLDAARDYRKSPGQACGRPGRSPRKDYATLLLDYDKVLPGGTQTPRQIFTQLAGPGGFVVYANDVFYGQEAEWGLQETLNELMAAQLMQGNELLLQGLRTRFPNTGDPADPDQLTLLNLSVDEFTAGIALTMDELRQNPEGFRAQGNVVPTYPFWVENAAPAGATNETVESDLYRLTELVSRRGVASNAVGKRKFFFGNASDAGRDEAKLALKQSAQATYLHTALLGAVQDETDFQNNNGYELKRQVVDAQDIFANIVAGFNPLELLGDFVPRVPVDLTVTNAFSVMDTAKSAECDVSNLNRQFDEDQTALNTELSGQKQTFTNRISELTGIPDFELPDLTDAAERREFLQSVTRDLENCIAGGPCEGELGNGGLAIQEAELGTRSAVQEMRDIFSKVRIEEEREGKVATITYANGAAQAALTLAAGIAESVETCVCGLASGVKFKPGTIIAAGLNSAGQIADAIAEASIEGINSAAEIKTLLLQQAQAAISIERASVVMEARKAELRGGLAELERTMRDFASSQETLACAYYSNPAYRLQLSQAQRTADQRFEAAMVQAYFAAKSMEYEWAERLENPVACGGADCPKPIGDTSLYNPIARAESVFASKSAGCDASSPMPSIELFLESLRQWDLDLRGYRQPADNLEQPFRFSMRKDILGLVSDGVPGSADEERSILRFRDFVAANRLPGRGVQDDLVFTFGIQVGDQSFFPDRPNLKIESIKVNLVPREGFPIRGSGVNAPLVSLVMRDVATLRTFFADPINGNDDLLHLELEETVNVEQSRFGALITASVDGEPVISPDVTLENLSPAVSQWTLKIDMDQGSNTDLILENLADIELTFGVRFNAPPIVSFP